MTDEDIPLGFILSNKKTLHQAAREGNVDEVNSIISTHQETTSVQSGISFFGDTPFVDELDDNGMSALHYACRHDNVEVVTALLHAKASPISASGDMVTPLHLASKYASISTIGVICEYLQNENQLATVKDQFGTTAIHNASQRASGEVLQFILGKCNNPDVVDNIGETPLHWCAADGFVETARVLIDNGATVSCGSKHKITPLHFAARSGNVDIMEMLLKKDTNLVNIMDDEGKIPLHYAVASTVENAAQLLLEHNSNLNKRDTFSLRTPLHIAAKFGAIPVVALLLKKGARRHVRDKSGYFPLHNAAKKGNTDVVRMLLEGDDSSRLLEVTTKYGETPLSLAASGGHVATMNVLITMNASPYKADKLGQTPLHLAVERGHVDAVEVLISYAKSGTEGTSVASFNEEEEEMDEDSWSTTPTVSSLLEVADKYDTRPLHVACKEGHFRIAQLLVNAGAGLDEVDDADQTPMHLAVKNGHLQIVKLLLTKNSALVASEDDTAQTALHLAAKFGYERVVDLLLDNGADIDAADDFHQTPLMEAAMTGKLAATKELVENDCAIDAKEKKGNTALLLAAMNGHAKIVKFLLESGANIAHQNKKGFSCLDIAARFKHLAVAKVIIGHSTWQRVLKCRIKKVHIANGTDSRLLGSSPFKQLIIHLPDAAKIILDKCLWTNGLTLDHVDYEVNYNFEYLLETGEKQGNMEPPEFYLTSLNREQLLLHPVATTLLNERWNLFGKYVYFTNLFIYLVFVLFVTIFVVDNSVDEVKTFSDLSTPSKAATWFVVVYAFYGIASEFYQMIQLRKDYIDWRNFLDWSVYLTSIMMVLYPYTAPQDVTDPALKLAWDSAWYAGSVCVFLTWMNLLVFVRRFGSLGVYILMFTDTLATVMKVMSVFSIFIVAFGLAFYVLLHDQESFQTPGNSLTRVVVMMTGEYNFDNIFYGGNNCTLTQLENRECFRFREIMYPLFIAFVVLMNISVMNLLIGLAVGDIEKVSQQASVNRQAIKASYLHLVFKTAPRRVKSRLPKAKNVKPNIGKSKGVLSGLKTLIIEEGTSKTQSDFAGIREDMEAMEEETKVAANTIKNLHNKAKAASRALGKLSQLIQS
eukprot:m.88322 g.88322  ORF g.88322 m.88322 type:complete len:1100 (-) comp8805_c1_seq1:4842-8141(-)